MSEAINRRFVDYVTSGAFKLNLSRDQISCLSMVAQGGDRIFGTSGDALERKGLVAAVPHPSLGGKDGVEYRPTAAGLFCLHLLREGGLVNSDVQVEAELEAMRLALGESRIVAEDSRKRAWSFRARQEQVEEALRITERERDFYKVHFDAAERGIRLKVKAEFDPRRHPGEFRVRAKDPFPELSDKQLAEGFLGKRPEVAEEIPA